MLNMAASDFYRANTSPYVSNIDTTVYQHDYDPLRDIHDSLQGSELIKTLTIDFSFFVKEIVSFVGYVESTLHMKHSKGGFWCSPLDVEQLFIIATPAQSKYSFTLKSFTTDIRFHDAEASECCATLFVFDAEALQTGKEEIVWQSARLTPGSIAYIASAVHDKLVKFDDINVSLCKDKTYAIKIDVPMGTIRCGYVSPGQRATRTEPYFVHANGRLYHNKYSLRGGSYEDGKMYEIEFGC